MNGITFKGIHSSQFDLMLKSDNRQALSNVTRYTVQVPGCAGSVDFGGDTYGEGQISVILTYVYRYDMAGLMKTIEQVGGWLYDDGSYYDLIFDDAPNRKYKAKMAANLDVPPADGYVDLKIIFTVNPPHPFDLNNNPITPADIAARLIWDTAMLDPDGKQYLQTFPNNGNMRFTIGGTMPVKPVIKLIGNIPPSLSLTCGGVTLKFEQGIMYDGAQIDCDAHTVTRMSDGLSLYEYLAAGYDNFFKLKPGQVEIEVSAGSWSGYLSLAIEFTPQEAS